MSGSGCDHTEWSIDTFLTWKVDNLKEFLRKRRLKVSGTKPELAARCFCAHEGGVPVVPTPAEKTEHKAKLYTQLLSADGKVKYTMTTFYLVFPVIYPNRD